MMTWAMTLLLPLYATTTTTGSRTFLLPRLNHHGKLNPSPIIMRRKSDSTTATTATTTTKPIISILRGGGDTNVNNKNQVNTNISTEPEPNHQSTSSTSLVPVTIRVQTNTGSAWIDDRSIIELPLVNPQKRTILSLQQSIQRQLASNSRHKPPLSAIRLVYQGQIVTQHPEQYLADILDDEDDDDDHDDDETSHDDNGTKSIQMIMDLIPPVVVDDFHTVEWADRTTADLLLAYTTNEACIFYNTQQIQQLRNQHNRNNKEEEEEDDETENGDHNKEIGTNHVPLMSVQIRERAQEIQRDLVDTLLQSPSYRKLLSDPETPHQKELRALSLSSSSSSFMNEIRGERVRHLGISGIRGNVRRVIQHQFNIENWNTALKHCLLFLFFGYFGGRTNVSRTILFMGAPVMILLQARFVKLYLRQLLFTVLYHPPSIVLSLLPAPQQAILSLNMADAMKRIYSEYIVMDELTKQLLEDDPSIEDQSNNLSNVLTSKRFTVKAPKEADADDEDDTEEEEDDDADEDEGDDDDDDDDDE